MKKDKEIWKDIEGYEGLYQVSSHGRVKSLERKVKHWRGGLKTIKGKMLKAFLSGSTNRLYHGVALCKNGKMNQTRVHLLVAQYFVPNPDNLPEINHDDNNPLNNHYTNLEWVTRRENTTHGYTFKKTSSSYPGVCWDKWYGKWKAQIAINGKTRNLGLFSHELEAAESYQTALKQVV